VSDQDFILGSGARLHVTVAPFEDANALRKALLRTAKGIPLAADPLQMDVTVLKDVFIEAASSNDVEQCLFKCMERASYQDVKVTRGLFDDPKLGESARADLLEIYWKVIETNCAPFFVKAFSALKARMASVAAAPKSQ
jgi:hypothetical protein